MKDKLITLAMLLAIAIPLGTILDGAKAQNMSRTRGHDKSAERWKQINFCMRLPDIKDVQVCVEAIK